MIVHLKCSNAQEGPSLGYEIREGALLWTGTSDLTADALLAPDSVGRVDEDDETAWARTEAEGVLREILKNGPVLASEVMKEASEAGITRATLKRARASLGIQAVRKGEAGRKGGGQWWLSLPEGVQPSVLKRETF